jgi:hypothetical protein
MRHSEELKKKKKETNKRGKPITRYELKSVCFYVFKTPTNSEQ